jgi:hypothetical protein
MLGRPRARDDFEGFARWAYRISRWLHKGYYLVSLLRNGRLALVCGVREEHPQQPSPPEQVLVSSPAVAEEWLGASDYFRRDRPRDSGEFFVKPAAKHRGPG